MTKKVLIGITGKIGSGKSTFAKQFIDEGIRVFDTDQVSKYIMRNDPTVKNALLNIIGESSFFPDGSLNPKYIASIIFTDLYKKKAVEEVVHPLVTEFIKKQIGESDDTIIAIESAIMFRTGLDKKFDFDAIINVERDEEKIIDTLTSGMSSRVLDKDDVVNRLESQSLGSISGYARTITIENNGTQEEFKKLISHLIYSIKASVRTHGQFIPLTQRINKNRTEVIVVTSNYLPNIAT